MKAIGNVRKARPLYPGIFSSPFQISTSGVCPEFRDKLRKEEKCEKR
jgi:hypothetical protein